MIQNIHLKNFTIIDELDLDFHSGMIALTGETGAGKSIIIDAIELVLGARVDKPCVQQGHDKAEIYITFNLVDCPEAQQWLQTHELHVGNECLLRRIIFAEGRSRAFINGNPVTLHLLQELGTLLVNIHGQHEYQTLLQRDKQLMQLDAFGQHQQDMAAMNAIYKDWQAVKKRYESMRQLNQDQANRREFLQFQLEEFAKLNLQVDEANALNQEYKQLTHAEKLLQECQDALHLLSAEDHSIIGLLHKMLHNLENIHGIDSKITSTIKLAEDALIHLQEVEREIIHYSEKLALNPERLQEVEMRLKSLHELARKHRVSIHELIATERRLTDELKALDNSDAECEKLQQQLTMHQKNYLHIATQLTNKRTIAAQELSKLITQDMNALGMQGGIFVIKIQPLTQCEPHSHGLEKIDFYVSTNPGQMPQPLIKIASGGELSRISLAIHANTAKIVQPSSLIFDEIDTGVGGGTAEMIGHLLRKLGESAQVFCITHLPQVAALAQHHYRVQKNKHNDQTSVIVNKLDTAARINEIARMLGGMKISQQTADLAREMLAVN